MNHSVGKRGGVQLNADAFNDHQFVKVNALASVIRIEDKIMQSLQDQPKEP